MKQSILDFFDDNTEELGLGVFGYIASHANPIAEFLSTNGWSANLFFVGLFGQFLLKLLLYVGNKAPVYKTRQERVGKNLAALTLGGCTAMVVAGFLFPDNVLAAFITGAFFQIVWDKFLMGYLDKFLPNTKKPNENQSAARGGDVNNDSGGM